MRALTGIRDPFGLLLAAAAALALLAFQEGPLVAILAAVSVLAVRVAAAPVIDRARPRPPSPPAPRFPPPPPGQPWYFPLTRRESEVALLVAEGLTNREIGERLHSERTVDGHVTERGVDSHVQNIMNSLNMNRRTQISAWVTERRPREIASKPPTSR
jgi:DNA-binding NarL/FixJ family response regulator